MSVEASLGKLEGTALETVYDNSVRHGYRISKLDWDLKHLTMAGILVSLEADTLTFTLDYRTALNEGRGEMFDYDWMDPTIPDWTHYSRSNVRLLAGSMYNLNAALKVADMDPIAVRLLAGMKIDNWKWADSGQEYIYSTDGFRDDIGSFGGTNIINYEQYFVVPYVGIGAKLSATPFLLDARLLYSPLVFANDKDYHVLRELHYEETFTGGAYIGLGLSCSLDVARNIRLSLAADYQSIPEFKGDLKMIELEEFAVEAAGIGHESTTLSVSVGAKF